MSLDLAVIAPAEQVTDFLFEEGVLSWTPTGDQTLIIASRKQITFKPFDGVTYPEELVLQFGVKVVYRGRGEEVDLSSLVDTTKDFYLYFFSFNGVQSTEKYNREISTLLVQGEALDTFDETFDETYS